MKHTHHTKKRLAVIGSFGGLCAIVAFAIGMQTSGNVHTLEQTQAALTGPVTALQGDMDRDGVLTVADAEYLLERAAGLEAVTPQDIRTGDLDKDFLITDKDVLRLLRSLPR